MRSAGTRSVSRTRCGSTDGPPRASSSSPASASAFRSEMKSAWDTHRVAISNHRLLNFDGERVTFRWKDYAHGNKQRKMTLTATEFLRRFVQHILPRGFVRIRQYGFLANTCRTLRVALARTLLGAA